MESSTRKVNHKINVMCKIWTDVNCRPITALKHINLHVISRWKRKEKQTVVAAEIHLTLFNQMWNFPVHTESELGAQVVHE